MPRRERLSPEVFRLPIERIRAGYYSDAYFNLTKELLEREDKHARVTMQVFQKKHSLLGGIDEALAILKLCSDDWNGLEVNALYEGDEIEPHVTVLTDFDNDSVRTAVAVADALGDDLWGVRLDTSEQLVDRSLWDEMGDFPPTGVNAVLVRKVRKALDAAGHQRVKIVVSGGFTPERIREFERLGVPGDAYGVGSALLAGGDRFT